MSMQITVRFEPNGNVEFVGVDCVEKYEAAVRSGLADAFPGAEIELRDDSPFGTKVEGDFDSPQEEQDANDIVTEVLNRIGNRLDEICR